MNITSTIARGTRRLAIIGVAAAALAVPLLAGPVTPPESPLNLAGQTQEAAAIGGGYVHNQSRNYVNVRQQGTTRWYAIRPGSNSGTCCNDVDVMESTTAGQRYRTSGDGGRTWGNWHVFSGRIFISNVMVQVAS